MQGDPLHKRLRRRITYANVMSSIAVFLVLGGGAAFAAKKIGTKEIRGNAITTRKIKKNAVTPGKIRNRAITNAKIRDGAVTGAKINLATLGTVPSARTAGVADTLEGRTPISVFIAAGARDVATMGPFTIRVQCAIDVAGEDEGTFQLLTAVDGAAMDDNEGDEIVPFDVADNPAELFSQDTPTGAADLEASEEPGLVAVGPEGTAILLQNESIGFNLPGHGGQCYFGALLQKIG